MVHSLHQKSSFYQVHRTNPGKTVHAELGNPLRSVLALSVVFALFLLLAGCNSNTVLLADFTNDTMGLPPSTAQSTGTVTINTGSGAIQVVPAPNPDLPANNWCEISHPTVQTQPTELTGNFTQFGVGDYEILASLHIPGDSGVVTVQFEASNQSTLPFGPFMHLDFMPEGNVRIDDSNLRFGSFPRDENFVLSVNLVITQTSAAAGISLLGDNASGSINTSVQSNVLPLARQFGAVKFWVGFQHKGKFFVDDIVVSRKNS